MTFSRRSQVESILIELGWAFFCRYEACVEAFLKHQGLKLSKKLSLEDWLLSSGGIPPNRIKPVRLYRKLRNALHHDDGAAFEGSKDSEVNLYPDHMENFYEFFIWLGTEVTQRSTAPAP